jgi:hypothetical protein
MTGKEILQAPSSKLTKNIHNRFLPHWLTAQDMSIPCWVNGKLVRTLNRMVLATHEWDGLTAEREAMDDDIAYLIERPESFDIFLHKLFTSKYQKILDELKSDLLIDTINQLYGLNRGAIEFNIPVDPELYINDWYCLKFMYGEVLIGGLDENPYF